MGTPVATKQFVILARQMSPGEGLAALGTRAEVFGQLADLNTTPETEGEDVMYGPGIRIEMSPGEPVTQMLLTVMEEEIAWLVIPRIARTLAWRVLDPETGRELNG